MYVRIDFVRTSCYINILRSNILKKQLLFLFLLFAMLALLGLSCQSAPRPTPPVDGPSQAALDTLKRGAAETEAARKRAADFESPVYFPSDWESVEKQYAGAGRMPQTNDAEVDSAVEAYNAATDVYNGLFDKTIPLYAQAREDEIIAVREEFIATGLHKTFPEYLQSADTTALQALDQYEAKDYYTARDTAAAALRMYQTLKAGADAWLAREEIKSRGFESYVPGGMEETDETLFAAEDSYRDGDIAAARTGAEDALRRYTTGLNDGYATIITELRDTAAAERQAALDVKADVAVRDDFNRTDAIYAQAAEFLQAEQYRDAARAYDNSAIGFRAAVNATEKKRRGAEEKIREAEEIIEASDAAARQAEMVIEGGSK
jgi:hypothetical protein